jgi:hypothetical protein
VTPLVGELFLFAATLQWQFHFRIPWEHNEKRTF